MTDVAAGELARYQGKPREGGIDVKIAIAGDAAKVRGSAHLDYSPVTDRHLNDTVNAFVTHPSQAGEDRLKRVSLLVTERNLLRTGKSGRCDIAIDALWASARGQRNETRAMAARLKS
jgi:hypothetical protein